MFEKLKLMKERFAYLTDEISKPEVIADRELWQKLVKEHSDLETVIEKYDEYLAAEKSFEEAKELLSSGDDELKELAKAEFEEYKEKMEQLTGELKILLLSKDPNDGKIVVIEVRAGAGGEEAGLFGAELVRMYKRYAERHRWGVEDVTTNVTDLGGVKEVSFLVKGNGAYSKLKFESGVHRVQRVPETESQGRVHTSTATVAVLPEAEDVEVQIDEKDLKIDRFRSGGAGGQHVNKTESAIRITHLPTGIVVVCEDERSQIKNYEKAMKILKTRLYDHFQTMATKAITDKRSAQIGTGDRSERIRTYNFPQGRVSDHRIGLTLYSLGTFMDGDLDEMIEALQIANQNAQLTSIDE